MPNKKSGVKFPVNSKIALIIHYEPIGIKTIDDSTQIQLNFYRTKPKYKIVTYALNNTKIRIAPYESNYKRKASYEIKQTMLLASAAVHMHYRGKASTLSYKSFIFKKVKKQ